MEKLMSLKRGQYTIPDGCKALVKKNVLTILDIRPKKVYEKRCRNCKYLVNGYSSASSVWKTTVCLKKPKVLKREVKDRQLFFHIPPLHKPCEYFEQKEL